MSERATLLDKAEKILAVIEIEMTNNGVYEGVIVEDEIPGDVVAMFRELEQCANEQLLHHVDELDRKIASLHLSVRLRSGVTRQVEQPFIAHGTAISFKLSTPK